MAQDVTVQNQDADFFDVDGPFNAESTALAIISPMDSMRTIFEEIRDGINTLVDLTMNMGPSASDLRDQNIGDADVKSGGKKTAEAGDKFKMPEMPKVGPKMGMLLMLAGLTLLFQYADQIEAVLSNYILPAIKKAVDFFGVKGLLYTGLGLLLAVKFGGPLLALLGGGAKGVKFAFGLLKSGFTTMKDAITAMPGLIKGAYTTGKKVLGGAFGLLKEGFNTLKNVMIDKIIPGIKTAAGKGKDAFMFVVDKLRLAFVTLKGFMLKSIIPGIKNAAGGVGGLFMKAVTGVTTAFTVVRTFMMATLIPAITAMLGPFAIPLGLVVLAVAAAVAIFVSIKAGIDEFKQSLADGDSMLVAIIEGVTTALLTLVTLPVTLIKNFVAWVADKLGFEGIAEKLKEFSIVDFIKNGIKTLVIKAKDFVLGLFNIDFKKVLGKFVDIGASIGRVLKAIALGSIAAVKAAFPGGESPMEAFKRVYDEVSSKGNDSPQMPDPEIDVENEGDYKKDIRSMDDVRKEELVANEKELEKLALMDEDTQLEDGHDVESKTFELEQRNEALFEMLGDKLDTSNQIALDNAALMMSIANSSPGPTVINTNNSTNNNPTNNTSIAGDVSIDHQDKTADELAVSF